jgi:hypothetical protein
MTEAHNTLTKANEIPLNREVENSTSVEELRHYIQFLHSAIPTLHKNQETLWAFGEKMVERVKTEKEKFRSQNQNFSKLHATHSEILDLYQEEQECGEENQKLIKKLTLKHRKLKKRNCDLEEGMLDLQSRVEDYEWVLECEEKLKLENAELKEKLKHYLPWYERAKMEETENNDDN